MGPRPDRRPAGVGQVPEFLRRVYLNALVYRVRYLRVFLALAAVDLLVLRRPAAAAAVAAALLSAAVVRSVVAAESRVRDWHAAGTWLARYWHATGT